MRWVNLAVYLPFDKWTPPYVCEAFFTKEVVSDEDAAEDNINDNPLWSALPPRFSHLLLG